MSLAVAGLFLFNEKAFYGAVFFLIGHAVTSFALFFLIGLFTIGLRRDTFSQWVV